MAVTKHQLGLLLKSPLCNEYWANRLGVTKRQVAQMRREKSIIQKPWRARGSKDARPSQEETSKLYAIHPRDRINFYQRVMRRCRKVEGGCMEWTGAKSGFGHGRIRLNGSLQSPHRVVYIAMFGAIRRQTPELVVMHKCDNPACCNPDHLRLGSRRQNAWDAQEKGRLERK